MCVIISLFFCALVGFEIIVLFFQKVELQAGLDANAVAASHGFKNLGQIGSLPNMYRFTPIVAGPHAARAVEARAVSLRGDPSVIFAEAQVKKQQHTRSQVEGAEM
jgi:hypothetical protein